MDYATKHADALAKVRDKGMPVSFGITTEGEYDATTDTYTDPSNVAVDGYAVEIPGDPEEYAALDLIASNPITLFFVPNVLGQEPELNSMVAWSGTTKVAKRIFPIRPKGQLIAAKVICT